MSKEKTLANKMTSGLAWTFMERIAAQLVSTVVSIVLARILDPEHYGIISIVLIFINICNVFVSDGFGKVLVQRKAADDLDFNTMFWFGLALSTLLYFILFLVAPFIEEFYKMEQLAAVLRVLGIKLIITAFNTIQQAYIQRQMEFKKFFFATIIGTIISAVVGIVLALKGFGVWALVAQYLTNSIIDTFALFLTCGWRAKFQFSFIRLKKMIKFTTQVILQSAIASFEESIRGLIIGKKFGSADLAFYNKGRQFPSLLVTNINASVGKVMLPAVASQQEDKERRKNVIRKSCAAGMFVLCPAMMGLFGLAETFVSVILTDKWLSIVPYLRIFCIAYLLRPFETACSSSILATGRSDVVLKNKIIINISAIILVLVAVFVFESIPLIAITTVITAIVSVVLDSYWVKRLFSYNLGEQITDVAKPLLLSIVMAAVVLVVGYIDIPKIILMFVQIIVGAAVYIILAKIFKMEAYDYYLRKLKTFINKFKNKSKEVA